MRGRAGESLRRKEWSPIGRRGAREPRPQAWHPSGGHQQVVYAAEALQVDGIEAWELHGEGGARCLVLPELGSQIGSLRLTPGPGRAAVETISAPSPGELRHAGWGAGAPILFPFPGRITGGEYTYRGRGYRIAGGHGRHPLHGFVGLAPWGVAEAGTSAEGAFVHTYVDHADLGIGERAFPGDYRLHVTHRLGPDGYTQEILLENTGTEPFPFGYGWHPYHPVPLLPGGARADCTLTLRARARWELTAELVPTGRRLEVAGPYDLRSPNPLGEKSYDDPFTLVEPDAGGGSSAVLTDARAGLALTAWADASFREWVVYSPRTLGAVCLEPYTCAPDAFNLQARGIDAGVRELSPGERWPARIGVRLGPAGA